MFLKKSRRIIQTMIRFSFKRIKLYPFDTILNFISSVIFLIGSILFWYFVTDAGFEINGWSYEEILVFIGFSELFLGLDEYIFSTASNFWILIYNGILETQLTRPFDPRKRFIYLNIDYAGVLSTFLKVILIFSISGIKMSIINIFIGLFVVFTSSLSFMFLRFSVSYLAFWFSKVDALSEICNCLTKFDKYPLVIFPKTIRFFCATILPFYFFSTCSAQIVLGKIDTRTILCMFVLLTFNLALWIIINNIIWKKGRRRYESLNG